MSDFPLTAPIIMPMRMSLVTVSPLEVIGVIAGLLVTCAAAVCEAAPEPDRADATLIVELVGYMDDALRHAGAGPWDRTPQAGFEVPPAPWVERAR